MPHSGWPPAHHFNLAALGFKARKLHTFIWHLMNMLKGLILIYLSYFEVFSVGQWHTWFVAVGMNMSLLFRSSAFTRYTAVVIRSRRDEPYVSARRVCWSETLRHTASVPFGPWPTSSPSWEVRIILSYSTLSILMVGFAPTRPLTGELFQFISAICMCLVPLWGIVGTSLYIYYIPTNCTNLLFIYKQHIKTFVLFKLLKLLLHVSVADWPSSGRYNIFLNFSY